MLAISSLTEARRHAVLNHNPFLDRITHEDLAAFENGVAQPVMEFPLEKSNSWGFTLFSIEWQASVIDLSGDYVTMRADSDEGGRIDYVFDRSANFFSSFICLRFTPSSPRERFFSRWASTFRASAQDRFLCR